MSDELLEVRDLTVTFGARGSRRRGAQPLRAVDGVALSVGTGELVALVGESGCGKTTTANAILRLVDPVAGSIRLRGREISRLRGRALRQLRRELQLVFQDPYEALDPRHRVRQIVEQPLRIHGIGASGEERVERVAAALERVGLDPASRYLERFSHELSGGQRQRVSIAATLALEPALLVADEPVSMLDVSVRSGILALLEELKAGGMGILMITHDLATAARYADRIAVMYMGRIVEQGAARAVVGDPRHPYTRALVAAVPPRDPRRRIELPAVRGEVADATAVPSGCAFRTRCPLAVQACSETRPALARPARAAQGHEAACVRLDARTPVGA